MRNSWKKTAAFVLAFSIVATPMASNMIGIDKNGVGIVVHAADDEMPADLSNATVTLGANNTVSSVTVGGNEITDLSEFDITYGTDESHTATEPPTEDGTYHAYVTAKTESEKYTGTAKSEAFAVKTVSWDADEMYYSGDSSFSKDGVTVEADGDAHQDDYFWNDGKNTFKADGGKITKIEILCTYWKTMIDGWTKEVAGKHQPYPDTMPEYWENIYKLTWTGEADSVTLQNDVYHIQSLKVTYTRSVVELTADNVTIDDFTYDGTEKTPVLKYGETTLLKDTDYELLTTEGDTASVTNAGTYTIHINGKGDYAGENIALTWKINKADVNVTADAKSKKYGEDDPVLTYTAGALFGTDAFTGALARAEGDAVNTYAITQGTLSAGDNYNINFTGADFTINKADPTPDAVTGLTAAFGKKLSDVTLPTGWTWDAPDTSVGDVGNNTFAATFTPTDTANYNNYSANLTVAVTAISATPTAVGTLNATYGDTLADVDLPTPEDGTWAWKDAGTTSVGNAGEQTFKAVFTPSSPNYTAVEQDVTINVAKADPTPDAVTGLTVAYGKKLSDVTLPTGWTWDAPATSVGNVGNNTFAATFTPTDTANYNNYSANLTVAVTAIPANPAAVDALNATYGQTLADVTLPTVEGGTWAWKDALTTSVGNAGTQTFTALYTPTSANYTAIERDITVNVAKAAPTPDAVTGLSVAYGKTLADVALPTGWTWDDDTLSVGNVGSNSFAATYTPDDTDNYNTVQDNLTVTVVPVEKTALNDAITTANTYYDTIKDNADYATPVSALSTAITAANAVYTNDNVTEAQVAQAITDVNNAVTTAKAAVKDIDDTKAAQAVTDKINALPAAEAIKSTDKEAIEAAREAYTKLTEAQSAKVTKATTDKLTAAEKAVADRIAADAVIEKINAIGTVALTDESKALIDAARTAYDALTTDEQKALVSNYATLTAGEKKYSDLQIENAKTKIDVIGDIELTAESKSAIETARAAYNALTADQKANVANAKVLDYAEKLYDALEDKKTAEDEKAAAETAQATAEKAAADAKTAQTKAEGEAAAAKTAQATAETAQATAEKAAAEAKAAQTKAEGEAAAAKTAQATAEKAAADAKTAQAKAEEDAATAKTAQATAEKAAADAKTAQTKAEEDAAAAKTAQATAEKNEEAAKAAQTKAEADAAAAKTAQATAEKAAADAKTAQTKAEADAAAAKTAQATAEKAAADAKTAQTKAEADAAAAKTAQATAEKAAADAKTAQTKAEEDAAAAKTAQATAEKNEEAAKAAQTKAEADAAAAKTAQATAEKNAEAANSKVSDLTEKLVDAEKLIEDYESSGNVDEALKKQVAQLKEQLDTAKSDQNAAKEALAKAQEEVAAKIAAAEVAQEKAEEAQATAEQTAKEATEKAAAAEKAQATAEQTAKEATEKAAAAEEAQAVANQSAADTAIEKINAIGTVNSTNYCENKIVRARAIYDSLTDEQKALVPADILAKLTAAEYEYDTLPQTGMSGLHKLFAGLASLMGIAGIGLVKKSRKEDEEE